MELQAKRGGIQSGIVKDLEELLERKKSWNKVLQVSISKEGERELECFRFAFTYPQKYFSFAHYGQFPR